MRASLIISLIVGGLISGGLLLGDQLSGSEFAWMSWELPGIAAAYLFWGAAGSSVSIGVFICWLVNAVIYAAPIFVALTVVKLSRGQHAANKLREVDE